MGSGGAVVVIMAPIISGCVGPEIRRPARLTVLPISVILRAALWLFKVSKSAARALDELPPMPGLRSAHQRTGLCDIYRGPARSRLCGVGRPVMLAGVPLRTAGAFVPICATWFSTAVRQGPGTSAPPAVNGRSRLSRDLPLQ